jgi:hypothetical protein
VSRERTLAGIGWVAGAGTLGLTVSAVFSSMLRLPRGSFVLVYAVAVYSLAALFLRRTGAPVTREGRRRSAVALAVGLLLGGVLVAGVLGGPGGARPAGVRLAAALGWYGFVYGVADAVLLTVIPVLAVGGPWAAPSTGGRLRLGAAALAASLLVTALYHAGFVEFRGDALVQPLIGNAVVTLGYLLTGNPATPMLAHVLMHGAAVVHGMDATSQLPPHY